MIGIIETIDSTAHMEVTIAANEDAIKSIRILVKQLVEAAFEARTRVSQEALAAVAEESRRPATTFTSADDRAESAS